MLISLPVTQMQKGDESVNLETRLHSFLHKPPFPVGWGLWEEAMRWGRD